MYDKIHFSGCTHFCHKNILNYEVWRKEKYKDELNMTDKLISEWNEEVTCNDLVIHLGDFGYEGKEEEMLEVIRQLNGTILFIRGNHDTDKFMEELEKMSEVYVADEFGIVLRYEEQNIDLYLSHYPVMLDWSQNRVSIHSHIHGKEPVYNYMFNIALDYTYKVVNSEEELLKRIKEYREHLTKDNLLKYYKKYQLKQSNINKENVDRDNITEYDINKEV